MIHQGTAPISDFAFYRNNSVTCSMFVTPGFMRHFRGLWR